MYHLILVRSRGGKLHSVLFTGLFTSPFLVITCKVFFCVLVKSFVGGRSDVISKLHSTAKMEATGPSQSVRGDEQTWGATEISHDATLGFLFCFCFLFLSLQAKKTANL